MRFIGDLWHRALPTTDSVLTNAALLVGRVMIVIALLPNGARKIATFAQTAAGMGGTPQIIGGRTFPDQQPLFFFPAPELFLGISVLLDIVGGLLIILGWKTRAAGAVLAGYVLLAMTIYHSDIRHAEDLVQIMRNLPFLGGLLMLAGVGGGYWSLDGWLARRKSRAA